METNTYKDLHSDEIHEIIDRPPSWIIRYGISVFFVISIILIIGSYVIKFPDIVKANFILTSKEAPRTIIARTEGKIQKLLVKNNDTVNIGDILAYMESTSDHRQILQLDKTISTVEKELEKSTFDFEKFRNIEHYQNLGELQEDYERLQEKLIGIKMISRKGFYKKRQELLNKDITDLESTQKNLQEQLELHKADLNLAKEEFAIHNRLQQDKVISPLEFNREKAKLLSKEVPIKNGMYNLIQAHTIETSKRLEILEIEKIIDKSRQDFINAIQTFKSRIDSWKQKHILQASIKGVVSYSGPWQEQQNVHLGDEIMTIEPQNYQYEGLILIPQLNIGKLRKNQKVLIKLNGYPFREFGIVEGKLSQLSLVPNRDGNYWATVILTNGLKTMYGKVLPYKNGLTGNAEIVTRDVRLIERIFVKLQTGDNI